MRESRDPSELSGGAIESARFGTARHAMRSPPLRRCDADDRELRDAVDLAERALDVVGVHVLARRRDDDVLDASDDRELPALVELAEIARVEPAVVVEHARRGLVVGVAGITLGPRASTSPTPLSSGESILISTPGIGFADVTRRVFGDGLATGEHGRGFGEAVAFA